MNLRSVWIAQYENGANVRLELGHGVSVDFARQIAEREVIWPVGARPKLVKVTEVKA